MLSFYFPIAAYKKQHDRELLSHKLRRLKHMDSMDTEDEEFKDYFDRGVEDAAAPPESLQPVTQ